MRQGYGVDVAVDRAECIGNGACVALAPRTFALDASMKAIVLDPDSETQEALEQAARACPTQAIYLSIHGHRLYP